MPTHPNLKSTGAAASLLFYERFRGLHSNSVKEKNTFTTSDKRNSVFSVNANRIAKQACIAMSQLSQLPAGKELLQRLSYGFHHCFEANPGQLHEPLNHLPVISGFRFNSETSLNQKLETNIEVDWKLKNNAVIKIPVIKPRLDIIAPARTLSINLKFISVCIPAKTQRGSHFLKKFSFITKTNQAITVSMPYTKGIIASKEIHIPVANQPGCINLIIASLEYITMQNGKLGAVTDKKWMPVDILSAVYIK